MTTLESRLLAEVVSKQVPSLSSLVCDQQGELGCSVLSCGLPSPDAGLHAMVV